MYILDRIFEEGEIEYGSLHRDLHNFIYYCFSYLFII